MNLHVRRQRCALVIPCYNEAQRLNVDEFIRFVQTDGEDIELVFVDDGSTDQTLSVLKDVASFDPSRIHVTQLARNSGKAEAVRQGMLWSLNQGYDLVAFWDADLATPLSTVLDFLNVMERHAAVDVVWGTRLPLLGHHIDRDFVRRQIGRVNSALSAVAAGVPIHDALCGAKMFRSSPRLSAVLSEGFHSRWVFDVELLARLSSLIGQEQTTSLQACMYEFPLEQWDEIKGSKLRPTDFARAFIDVAAIFWRYRLRGAGKSLALNAAHHTAAELTLQTISIPHTTPAFVDDLKRAA